MSTIAGPIWRSFASLMQKAAPFEASPALAVAVSGGVDSLALLLLAAYWAKEQGGRVVGLTVDHALRRESTEEAHTVHQFLTERGIEHHVLLWEGEKPQHNIQALAREARYRLLAGWCRSHHILHLLVAHHLDDQAETFLLRLQRGSGVDGLSAMPLVSRNRGVRILRPLLGTPKAALEAWLRTQDVPWVEDPSNYNLHYTRSHIRQFLHTPFGGGLMEPALLSARLANTASHMGRARAALEQQAAQAMVHMVDIFQEGYATLKRDQFLPLPEEVALRILVSLLSVISGNYYKPRFEALYRLYQHIHRPGQMKAMTLWGCYIAMQGDKLLCCREAAAMQGDISVMPGETALWDNRFLVRAGNRAIRVGALGEDGVAALREQNHPIFLPKKVIITLPTFKTLETIIAVPHINFYTCPPGEKDNTINAQFAPPTPLAGGRFCYTTKRQ